MLKDRPHVNISLRRPVNIIVAVDQAGGFGKDGKIPWKYPADLEHFKNITGNSICVMGRKTYEDMVTYAQKRWKKKNQSKELLPGRSCYVVTSNTDIELEGGAERAVSFQWVVEESIIKNDTREIFIIGGEKLFIEALPSTKTVYMTVLYDEDHKCDRFFPIKYLDKYFVIKDGTKKDNLMFMVYQRRN